MCCFVVKIMARKMSLTQLKRVKPIQRSTHVLGDLDYCRRMAAEHRCGVPVTYFTIYHIERPPFYFLRLEN